jgi:Helix-hairpin-helix domain
MKAPKDQPTSSFPKMMLSNAEIADRLASLAQLLSAQKENPYKVKAYRRAAAKIRTLSESIDELVRNDADRSFLLPAHDEHPGFFLQIVHF